MVGEAIRTSAVGIAVAAAAQTTILSIQGDAASLVGPIIEKSVRSSLEDCIGSCGLDGNEVSAIAQHEHEMRP
jgi:hypothetical protein